MYSGIYFSPFVNSPKIINNNLRFDMAIQNIVIFCVMFFLGYEYCVQPIPNAGLKSKTIFSKSFPYFQEDDL